jgi:hypothetical protein
MSLPIPPSITQGQLALDPVNGIVYYKDDDDNLVKTTFSWLRNDLSEVSTDDNITITGNLIVEGSTVTVDAETIVLKDNFILLNSNDGLATASTAGIEVERGAAVNVQIRWNESVQKWQFTNDGVSYLDLNSITNDSVTLGTHTAGEYVENISGGTGVTVAGGTGEGSNPTISIGQAVNTNSNVSFNTVTADLIGDVTGDITGDVTGTVSDISNHTINDLSDVSIADPNNGDFLRYNGASWINDPVNLATDTIGDYVSRLTAGTGITITNNSGEGATPTIAFSGSIDSVSDIVITSAVNGELLEFNGTNWVNAVRPSSEPIGHENKADSVISFNESTREFSIAPASTSYTVWCTGKRYVKTSTETIEIPDTSGLYYIYFNSSGSLAYKTTFFTWDQDTPTAYIYWNEVDNKAYFFADERHGITLDWATHEYLHRTRGAAIANGFGANNYTLTGDGSLDAHAQIDIADGTFFDEDLQVDITHSSSPTVNTWEQRLQSGAYIPVFYRLNSHWKKDTATQFPVKNGGTRAQYNLNTAGTWSATAIDNSKFGVMFLVATNNLNEPVISIMGQEQYTDQGSAEASTWDELDLGGFPIVEFRPLYKIVFQTANAYTNTAKTRFVNLLDLRQIISAGAGGSSVAVSDHGNMTGLQDDDHTQYLNDTRHNTLDHSTALGTASINDLSDVSISSAVENQGLIWNGTAWVNTTIPLNLDGLTDVVITSATPNHVLKFNGTTWVNALSPSSIEGTTYTDIIGDDSTSTFVINHNLSTRDVVLTLRENTAPYASLSTLWEATDLNNITIYFDSPPTSQSIRVAVYAAVSGIAQDSLSNLADVSISSIQEDEILVWNGSQWINAENVSTASVASVDDIGDVTISSATPNHYLRYNGSQWENSYITLGTNTNGNYMSNISAGTGISVSHTQGEGSTATVSVDSVVVKTTDTGVVTPEMLATGPAKAGFRYQINAQTGTSYTIQLSDLAKMITMDSSSSMTITVPPNSAHPFEIGDSINILRKGSGSLTVQGGVGVSVNATPGAMLRAQWSSATLVKLDTNVWVLIGDLQA